MDVYVDKDLLKTIRDHLTDADYYLPRTAIKRQCWNLIYQIDSVLASIGQKPISNDQPPAEP